ncbi:PilZ domain-containing protein [Candidatus Omnitrophota bacterium]
MDNQRKDIRYSKDFSLCYKVKRDGGDVEIAARVENISIGGMQFFTSQWLAKDSTMEFIIRTPLSKKEIVLFGKVLECERNQKKQMYESRITFVFLDEKTKKEFTTALEEIRWHKK